MRTALPLSPFTTETIRRLEEISALVVADCADYESLDTEFGRRQLEGFRLLKVARWARA